ncbi:MAG: hypothetical protein H6740_00725 [Alphaproteobacteria bacterium]|nr:hypothetical protein [Alphaproteobacteria bacterium]
MSDRERNFPDLGFEESEASQSHWEEPDGLPPEDWEDAEDLPPSEWEDPDGLPPDDWEDEEPEEDEAADVSDEDEVSDEDASEELAADAEDAEDAAEDAEDEPRAIDLIRQAETPPPRRELLAGERLSQRVNARWNTAPGSERRSRLFARMGRPDPYDPDAKERPISMGSVALKLDGKRQPAPHARPKERKKKQQRPPTPNVPAAPRPKPRAPTPAPTPAPKAAPPAPQVPRRADGTIDRRPPRVEPTQQKTGFFSPPQSGAAPSAPSRAPSHSGGRGNQPRLAAGRSRAERSVPQPLPEGVDRTPPKPKTKQKQARAGRLRMSRQELSPEDRGPVVIETPKLREAYTGPDPEGREEAKPPAPEPPRRLHKEAESLDDLFGFSQNEGRLRMPRRKKDGEGEGE